MNFCKSIFDLISSVKGFSELSAQTKHTVDAVRTVCIMSDLSLHTVYWFTEFTCCFFSHFSQSCKSYNQNAEINIIKKTHYAV